MSESKAEKKGQSGVIRMTNRELFDLCTSARLSGDMSLHLKYFVELERRLLRVGFLPALPPPEETEKE